MYPVKCASQDEIVVCREFLKVGGEFAVVDEATSFVDDDEGVDDPGKGAELASDILTFNTQVMSYRGNGWKEMSTSSRFLTPRALPSRSQRSA